ncbi:hypothetical protein PR048_019449 [Dryococelus australis]|uniref:Uncharacterized protein n=1 Tax=Dryococelus australis TaxID=614101 RepID=A0ABQ9H3L1_9NEOP|nr:hypothetical protein PR048_019449 [Dryococelus australis]
MGSRRVPADGQRVRARHELLNLLTVAADIHYSPPAETNHVRFPLLAAPGFSHVPLVGGFSQRSSVSPSTSLEQSIGVPPVCGVGGFGMYPRRWYQRATCPHSLPPVQARRLSVVPEERVVEPSCPMQGTTTPHRTSQPQTRPQAVSLPAYSKPTTAFAVRAHRNCIIQFAKLPRRAGVRMFTSCPLWGGGKEGGEVSLVMLLKHADICCTLSGERSGRLQTTCLEKRQGLSGACMEMHRITSCSCPHRAVSLNAGIYGGELPLLPDLLALAVEGKRSGEGVKIRA